MSMKGDLSLSAALYMGIGAMIGAGIYAMRMITKMMGLILAVLGVQMLLEGLIEGIRIWHA